MKEIERQARQGGIIVLAGAGVSAGQPSALPGWKPLNKAIIRALFSRLEAALGERIRSLAQFNSHAMAMLDKNLFPPEYQAQLIHEMCGERYFRGLQSLDVDIANSGHEAIASLASVGALKAVVTTNFDRLLEQALARRGVTTQVAYDDDGFATMADRLRHGPPYPLPVIKIHGCVSAHTSMIDTLKQRQRSRTRHLEACLDALEPGYWLYLGFSARDLETNSNYLGFADRARRSHGGTYLARPTQPPLTPPKLSDGAQLLMNAHGDHRRVVQSEIAEYLLELCNVLGAPGSADRAAKDEAGFVQFTGKLAMWADALPLAAAGLCLAAIYEGVGNGEGAARLLDRLVRHELYAERDTADFRENQLHYGRLGAAWGRFVGVPDVHGAESNASVESKQSLLRIEASERGFAASTWLAVLCLWLNMGDEAIDRARRLLRGLVEKEWAGIAPPSDEELADAWASAAQVCIISECEHSPTLLHGTVDVALQRARAAGDVVRAARVAALHLLGLGRTEEDVPALSHQYTPEFAQAERVGDGFALGMRALALGRWYVGPGGLALAEITGRDKVAVQALESLQAAISAFARQGMDPWIVYSRVQMMKALGDLHRFDEAQEWFERTKPGLERFRILRAHAGEAVGQLLQIQGRSEADQVLEHAMRDAESSGLCHMRDLLRAQRDALRQ